MKKVQVWIAKTLYEEIIKSKQSLEEIEKKKRCKKKKRISFISTTKELGKYLNTIRNKK